MPGLIDADALRVDMSTLTGESLPVARSAGAPAGPVPDPIDAEDLVFAGTYVTSGSARVVVARTGPRTRLGGIATLTGGVTRRPTPLRLDLDRAVRILATFAVGAGTVFFGAALVLGIPLHDGFLFGIGVIVALVPEGLLPTLTLSLAMSATRMARRGAVVRHLESVETLGATTVDLLGQDGHHDHQPDDGACRPDVHARGARDTAGWAPGGTLLEHERPLDETALGELDPLLRVGRAVRRRAARAGRGPVALRGRPDRGRAGGVRAQGRGPPRRRGATATPGSGSSPSAPSGAG